MFDVGYWILIDEVGWLGSLKLGGRAERVVGRHKKRAGLGPLLLCLSPRDGSYSTITFSNR